MLALLLLHTDAALSSLDTAIYTREGGEEGLRRY